jgi:hypothetical protein
LTLKRSQVLPSLSIPRSCFLSQEDSVFFNAPLRGLRCGLSEARRRPGSDPKKRASIPEQKSLIARTLQDPV